MYLYRVGVLLVGAAFAARPGVALAQESGPIAVSEGAELASDYRFRGVSRSDENPAARADIDITLPVGGQSNLFAGAEVVAATGHSDFGNAQLLAYAGIERQTGAFTLSAGGRAYLFPDAHGRDYVELFASGRTQLGPLSGKLGFAYVPTQANVGGRRGVYLFSDLDAGIPSTPLTISAHLGWEDNATFRNKADWSLNLTWVHNPWSLGVGYVDTNRHAPILDNGRVRNDAKATLVVTAGLSF
ncbi:TorF family putative porin [Sphingomonas sp. DC1600-2]|uniref:TorF family putative porin n=1 Tax=unclassified Sphingomonas TaxID=196159 RepID=UPI003CEF810A